MKNGFIVIGDVHGKVNEYAKIIEKNKKTHTIQVGDFGFKKEHEWHLTNLDSVINKVCFGNHDDYSFLSKEHSLGDFSFFDEVMTVRGALSIDKHLRVEGVDWWPNEELNYKKMQDAIDFYVEKKPKIMVTHDCPDYVRRYLFGIRSKSLTSNGLESMFECHQPDLWIFGHHHRSKNHVINGTRFVCLKELEAYKV